MDDLSSTPAAEETTRGEATTKEPFEHEIIFITKVIGKETTTTTMGPTTVAAFEEEITTEELSRSTTPQPDVVPTTQQGVATLKTTDHVPTKEDDKDITEVPPTSTEDEVHQDFTDAKEITSSTTQEDDLSTDSRRPETTTESYEDILIIGKEHTKAPEPTVHEDQVTILGTTQETIHDITKTTDEVSDVPFVDITASTSRPSTEFSKPDDFSVASTASVEVTSSDMTREPTTTTSQHHIETTTMIELFSIEGQDVTSSVPAVETSTGLVKEFEAISPEHVTTTSSTSLVTEEVLSTTKEQVTTHVATDGTAEEEIKTTATVTDSYHSRQPESHSQPTSEGPPVTSHETSPESTFSTDSVRTTATPETEHFSPTETDYLAKETMETLPSQDRWTMPEGMENITLPGFGGKPTVPSFLSTESPTEVPVTILDVETTTEFFKGCPVGEQYFKFGEPVPDPDPCKYCYCLAERVLCAERVCKPPRDDCLPLPIEPGQCCPNFYRCPVHTSTLVPTTEKTVSISGATESSRDTETEMIMSKDEEKEVTPTGLVEDLSTTSTNISNEIDITGGEVTSIKSETASGTMQDDEARISTNLRDDETSTSSLEKIATEEERSTTSESENELLKPTSKTSSDEHEMTTSPRKQETTESSPTSKDDITTVKTEELLLTSTQPTQPEISTSTKESNESVQTESPFREATSKLPEADETSEIIETTKEAIETTSEHIKIESETIDASESMKTTSESIESTSESIELPSESIEITSESVESTSESIETTSEGIESSSKSIELTSENVESTTSESIELTSEHIAKTSERSKITSESIETTSESIETTSESLETTSKHIEITSEHAETSSEHVETISEHVETTSEHVETTSERVETTSEHVETTSEHVVTTSESLETTGKHVEKTSEHAETTSESLETTSDYVETSSESLETTSEDVETTSEHIETTRESLEITSEQVETTSVDIIKSIETEHSKTTLIPKDLLVTEQEEIHTSTRESIVETTTEISDSSTTTVDTTLPSKEDRFVTSGLIIEESSTEGKVLFPSTEEQEFVGDNETSRPEDSTTHEEVTRPTESTTMAIDEKALTSTTEPLIETTVKDEEHSTHLTSSEAISSTQDDLSITTEEPKIETSSQVLIDKLATATSTTEEPKIETSSQVLMDKLATATTEEPSSVVFSRTTVRSEAGIRESTTSTEEVTTTSEEERRPTTAESDIFHTVTSTPLIDIITELKVAHNVTSTLLVEGTTRPAQNVTAELFEVTTHGTLDRASPTIASEHSPTWMPQDIVVSTTLSAKDLEKLTSLMSSSSTSSPVPVPTATTTTTRAPSIPSFLDEGVCYFEGRVYQSAEQIPRDNACEFCFCFRGDIICLQQSCPPPITHCRETPIAGFCCPRYECPVQNLTASVDLPSTTSTTTTSPTPPRAFRLLAASSTAGCEVKGRHYEVGEVVRPSSGPCLQCRCEEAGLMQCDPQDCKPQAPLVLRMHRPL